MARLKQKEVRRRAERDREVRQQKFNLKAHKRLHNPTSEPALGAGTTGVAQAMRNLP